jgi:hypothetical protein
MTMTLRSQIRPRERILLTGVGGTGKSHDILTMVAMMKADTAWLIENDNSFERMIQLEFGDSIGIRQSFSGWVEDARDEEFGGHMVEDTDLPMDPNGQVVLFDCGGKGGTAYQQMRWAKHYAEERCGVNDLISVDSFTVAWDRIKSMFIEAVHDSSMGAYFMRVRQEIEERNERERNKRDGGKEQKHFDAFDGMMDYQAINAVWEEDWMQFVRYPPCHLIITAELDDLNQKSGDKFAEKDQSVLALWGEFGVKPRGQKRSGHLPATVLMKRKTRSGEWKMTTVKDKGRPDFTDTTVENWCQEYLYRHAGFRMVDV